TIATIRQHDTTRQRAAWPASSARPAPSADIGRAAIAQASTCQPTRISSQRPRAFGPRPARAATMARHTLAVHTMSTTYTLVGIARAKAHRREVLVAKLAAL